ncbi:hypothetical protein L6164_025037 [Bauhinia variegata]|uniref:Uncharacterized protein n=1 Tax=Bauhinia variegata TaxID=167791 RepID=A0ACB9M0B7_BAUVA|nr:hypothetical protein L6164_025037 [Bauhinia variegata]
MQTGATSEKLFSLGKDECRKSCGLPQISSSRSSSKSHQNDFDNPDFTCPFVLDNDNVTDPSSRAGSFDHDAAIGALVRMLKEAPPLHQDYNTTSDELSKGTRSEAWSNNIEEPKQMPEAPPPGSITSSELIKTRKTTTDAWEEFQGYRKVKNLLLMGSSNTEM